MNDIGFKRVHLLKDEVLGSGSYGTVYRARLDNLVCAAKCMHHVFFLSNDPSSSKFSEMFRSECEMMSRLHHPNIVQYLGTITDPQTNQLVLFMELLDCSLTAFLESGEPFPYHLQVNFSHDISKALVYLHHNGLMHRDVNSNNVLLLGRMRAKLTDFDMSSILQHRKSRLTMCPGTAPYMPPEALTNVGVYNEKIDIFSMGVVLVHMMTRQFPNPTDAHKDAGVKNGRQLLVAVPELERRHKHISTIASTHPLLPIAKLCLKDKDTQRPSSDGLCQQIEALKTAPTYRQSVEQGLQGEREEGGERSSNIEALKGKVEKQQEEHQKLLEQLEQKNQELQEAQVRFSQVQQVLQEERSKKPIPTPTVKNLQRQLSVSKERNSKLEESVRQLEGWAAHLEKTMEQQRLSLTGNDGKYTAVLYTPAYITNTKKEWTAVLTLCPRSQAAMTTGLRKLINEMFGAQFASSSVSVTFSHYNTLTVGIHDDGSTCDHLIEFSITPPTIERDDVDLPKSDSGNLEKRKADDTYPPRIILTIRPSPHSNCRLRCKLLLQGVHTTHSLVLCTPAQLEPLLAPTPAQDMHPQHITVTGVGINKELMNSDMRHSALDQNAKLATVMNLCGSRIPQEWKAIGIQLGIPQWELNSIDANVRTVGAAISDMFARWQEMDTDPTWRKLLKALRTDHVKQHVLAYEIQKQLTTKK